MSRNSLISSHPNKLDMERAYLRGQSVRSIAKDYGVGEESLRNHCKNNLSRQLTQAWAQKELQQSFDLIGEIDQIIAKTKNIFNRSYEKNRDALALKAISEHRSTLELLCKISAYLHEAKLAELDDARSTRNDIEEQELDEMFSVLTIAEKDMLFRLNQKMYEQDSSLIIIPDKRESFDLSHDLKEGNINTPLRRTKSGNRMKSPKTTTVSDLQDDTIEKMTIKPIESVELTSTPWRDHPLNPRRKY